MRLSQYITLAAIAAASIQQTSAVTVAATTAAVVVTTAASTTQAANAINPYQYDTQGPTLTSGHLSSTTAATVGSTAVYDATAAPTTAATQSPAALEGSPDEYPNVQCTDSSSSHLAGVCYTYQLYQEDINDVFVTFKPENATDVQYVILHYANQDGTNGINPTMQYDTTTSQYETTIAVTESQAIEFSYTFYSNIQGAQVTTETCYYDNNAITCPLSTATQTPGSTTGPQQTADESNTTSTVQPTYYYGQTQGVSVSKVASSGMTVTVSAISVFGAVAAMLL